MLSENVTAMAVAQHYFRDGRTKSEIAKAIGISRFKVARILDRCRSERLVEIVFNFPDDFIDYALSAEIKTRFGLRQALIVADAGSPGDAILDPLGRAAALLLREVSAASDVLGFAWTRTLEAMTGYLHPLRASAVVQLCGAFPGAGQGRTSIEIVRDVARSIDGPAYLYYAPLIASDEQAAQAIRRQADVAAASAMIAGVTKAVVTIGAWQPGHSSVWNAVDPLTRQAVCQAGAVAEICGGICLDRAGRIVKTALADVAVGISGPELAAIPDVIGLAFGQEKAAATRAAIEGRMINALVSHSALARAILADAP